jgi:hypothetical protein
MRNANVNSSSSSSSSSGGSNNRRHIFVEYFKGVYVDMYLSLVSPQFVFACLFIALLMTFINLGLKSPKEDLSFDESYRTVAFTYGWTSTFVYVHGVGPYLLIASLVCLCEIL